MNYKVEVKAGSEWATVSNHFFATYDDAMAFVALFNNTKHEIDNAMAMFVDAY